MFSANNKTNTGIIFGMAKQNYRKKNDLDTLPCLEPNSQNRFDLYKNNVSKTNIFTLLVNV